MGLQGLYPNSRGHWSIQRMMRTEQLHTTTNHQWTNYRTTPAQPPAWNAVKIKAAIPAMTMVTTTKGNTRRESWESPKINYQRNQHASSRDGSCKISTTHTQIPPQRSIWSRLLVSRESKFKIGLPMREKDILSQWRRRLLKLQRTYQHNTANVRWRHLLSHTTSTCNKVNKPQQSKRKKVSPSIQQPIQPYNLQSTWIRPTCMVHSLVSQRSSTSNNSNSSNRLTTTSFLFQFTITMALITQATIAFSIESLMLPINKPRHLKWWKRHSNSN